jgi:hypothetical protein
LTTRPRVDFIWQFQSKFTDNKLDCQITSLYVNIYVMAFYPSLSDKYWAVVLGWGWYLSIFTWNKLVRSFRQKWSFKKS